MPKVHLLSPDVIAKIAAGEVIERPASVLKELVENSLDAGATQVTVRLESAGKSLIFIADDGHGIEREDLETIFLRHSTSKIRSIGDLERLRTMGFRGEALYSIAAIADVTLRSRSAQQDSGWEIHVQGGQKMQIKPVAMAVGTEIEVRELFFNTPARRKFLKSDTTEVTSTLNTFLPYALLYPKIRFRLIHKNKDLLDLPVDQYAKSRMAHALNLNEKFLIEANREIPELGTSLQLLLGDINIKRARRDLQFIFVNNRPVASRSISFHLNEIYKLILPPHSYPAFCLFVNLPTEEIDANIHPTKREVKIRNEAPIVSALRHLCEGALMNHGQPKIVGGENWGEENDHRRTAIGTAPWAGVPDGDLLAGSPNSRPKTPEWEKYLNNPMAGRENSNPFSGFLQARLFGTGRNDLREKLSHSRYIGQFIKKFLMFESGSSLLCVDQHAAQERITYELLKKQYETGNVEVQPYLTPVLIAVTPAEMLSFEESQMELEESGISCSQFDVSTIAIHGAPQLLRNPEATLRYFLSEGNVKKFNHELIARQACRSSVMAGDPLKSEQAVYQRDQLLACADPFICPHGRPTVIEMTEQFLDRQFLRT